MASSLKELLVEEGFSRGKFMRSEKKVKFRDKFPVEDSIALPIYICHDRKMFDSSKQIVDRAFLRNGSSVSSSKRRVSEPGRSIKRVPRRNEPAAIDEVATKAVVSILSSYVGQYAKDEKFRENLKENCKSWLVDKKPDDGFWSNLELGMESVEKLIDGKRISKELCMESLQNSIGLLSLVIAASNSSQSKRNDSSLYAFAHLYLSIVHKIERNERNSARHLLEVFYNAPFLARTHLLPELWEHVFLPHLLHIKIWHTRELEFLTGLECADKEKKTKSLSKVYNEQMDRGTSQFALYYKEWLEVGAQAPKLPSVPLPRRSSYGSSRRRSSDSFNSHSLINKSFTYGRRSMDLVDKAKGRADANNSACSYNEIKDASGRRLSGQLLTTPKPKVEFLPEIPKSDYFKFLSCRSEPSAECLVVHGNNAVINDSSIQKRRDEHLLFANSLSRFLLTICSSEKLTDCEIAIRGIANIWLDSHGDSMVEATLSQAQVIEGMLMVLSDSNDDEILELVISILAELVTRKEVNRLIVLNSDPLLVTLMRLLRNSCLFLKSAVLLYLVKPKAKQMVSIEWIPLVLRVLEFGDQLQKLFTVEFRPQVAAYYLLEQLISGFEDDKNLENARQIILLGGLSLLSRRIEMGDLPEKKKVASILCRCIQADGSCRHYIVKNLNKGVLLQILVLEKKRSLQGYAFALLMEQLCLHRTQAIKILNGLRNGWNSLDTMHILLVYLQKVQPEERPLVASVLLQLDFLGDPLKCSVYREEAIEAITTAMDCQVCYEQIQKQSAKALLMLGGCFSYSGVPTTEKWLLKESGMKESSSDKFDGRDITNQFVNLSEENVSIECWQRKIATGLFTCGREKFLSALSDSICNGIPCLARASLVTVAWMSNFLPSVGVGDENLCYSASTLLVPRLIEALNNDNTIEEKVLASRSLLNFLKSSDYASEICGLSKELMGNIQKLSEVTWTANEVNSMIR